MFPDTPADEMDGYTWKVTKVARSESESTNASAVAHIREGLGLGLGQGDETGARTEKRPAPPTASSSRATSVAGDAQTPASLGEDGGAKKKRRVALTHLGNEEQ